MVDQNAAKVKTRSFSAAFEQMCNFVAVAKTGNVGETIEGLIEICLLRFGDEGFDEARQFRSTIDTVFGIDLPIHQIEIALVNLQKANVVTRPGGTNLVLSGDASESLLNRCQEIEALEDRVRQTWLEECGEEQATVDATVLWLTLRKYLARAFRRHGLQTVALLDPTIDTSDQYDESLSDLLNETICDAFEEPLREPAKEAISDFLADIGSHADRSHYITQLADGAFNFFSLQVDPELSGRLRQKLVPLVLFLDTNFLFGILDLHHNQHVDVSHDLIRAVHTHGLPFRLRYHEATQRELNNTLIYCGKALRTRTWPKSLSRAAVTSRNLSGIEQRFHERNSSEVIDVAEFLRPYQHCDVLLREKGIEVFRAPDNRLAERNELFHEYQAFLEAHGKGDKAYETIQHDATLLDTVRHMKSRSSSSLDAGALIVTCDYYLYRFDWESARKEGGQACVVLPNTFWQVLRPFIQSDQNFERSFAETFALPEFRALGSGGSKACSRMLSVLASYRDVPEETAEKLLSNDVLLDHLRTIDDDGQFRELVDSAIVRENESLLEEQAALERELEQSKKEGAQKEARIRRSDEEKVALESRLGEIERQLEQFQNMDREKRSQFSNLMDQEATLQASAATTAADLDEERAKHRQTERQLYGVRVALASVSTAIGIAVFLMAVQALPWTWLQNHERSIVLQICFSLIIGTGFFGIFVSQWRKKLWSGSGIVALVLLVLGLMDV